MTNLTAGTTVTLLLWFLTAGEVLPNGEVPDARLLVPTSGDFQKLIATITQDGGRAQKTLCLAIVTNDFRDSLMRIDLGELTYTVRGFGSESYESPSPLAAWYRFCNQAGRLLRYGKMVFAPLGGAPGESDAVDAEYKARSPIHHLDHARAAAGTGPPGSDSYSLAEPLDEADRRRKACGSAQAL